MVDFLIQAQVFLFEASEDSSPPFQLTAVTSYTTHSTSLIEIDRQDSLEPLHRKIPHFF